MDLVGLLNQFIGGVTYGMIIFLIALGLTLIFGVMSIVNMAHGALYMLGAFLGYFIWLKLSTVMNFAFWPSVLLTGLAIGLFGFVLERMLRPFYARGHLDQILFTYAFIYIIDDIVKMAWGGQYYTVPRPSGLEGTIELGGLIIPTYNAFVIGVALLIAGALWWFLAKTKTGKIIRAAVFDREMVSLLGIPLPALFALVFVIGTFIVGAVGVLNAPMGNIGLGMDAEVLAPAFIVCIIGGMGSILGALVASLIIGLVYGFGVLVIPEMAMTFMYLVVVVVLIVRPEGLFKPAEK